MTLARALELGIDWFDTAAGYGQGTSERNLGAALRRLDAVDRVDLATKVRLEHDDLTDIVGAVRASIARSLERLGASRVTLIQLHNAVTRRRDDEPTSLDVRDVLGPGGVADALDELREAGVCRLIGFTGLGDGCVLRELIESRRFQTLQIPFSLANPSAGYRMRQEFVEANYGQVLDAAAAAGMGTFAIRVLAGGALAGNPPSDYTRATRFFKLDLYERDLARAARLRAILPESLDLYEAAVRFPFSHPAVSAAIVGMSTIGELEAAASAANRGGLPPQILKPLWESADVDAV